MWPDPVSGWLPLPAHMLFQGMFFIITPALICGAFAERMKFSAMVVFMILWGTLVYCPLCHWVWDAGILGFATTASIEAGDRSLGAAAPWTLPAARSCISARACPPWCALWCWADAGALATRICGRTT